MPFIKTYEVSKGFFDFFLNKSTKKLIAGDNREHPMLPIALYTGGAEDFMVRYFNRSGESAVEDVMAYYPSIIIQDFQPEVDGANLWGRDFIEGVIDRVSGKRERITLPIPMTFKFQVSVITRRLKEVQSAHDWFMQNFNFHRPDCMEFNNVETDEGTVGDIVPYTVEFNDVPRDDRRFEYSYMFDLNTFIHAKSKSHEFIIPEDDETEGVFVGGTFEDMVEKINVTLNMRDYTTFKSILQANFDIP